MQVSEYSNIKLHERGECPCIYSNIIHPRDGNASRLNHECQQHECIASFDVKDVGCIYASYPRCKSNMLGAYMHLTLDTSLIYFKIRSNHSNSYQNLQNTQKYFFLIFLYFYSHLFECPISFLPYLQYEGLYFASVSRFDSKSRSAYQLIGSTRQVGCLPTQALKCRVNEYMRVRQKLAYALSPQCLHSLRR